MWRGGGLTVGALCFLFGLSFLSSWPVNVCCFFVSAL